MIEFHDYLRKFERIVGGAVVTDDFGRTMQVSVREGKLYHSQFAKFLGRKVLNAVPFVIDYYGYFKRSDGFKHRLKRTQQEIVGKQLKTIPTTVVIFNSIRIEDLQAVTDDPDILSGFADFKSTILQKRNLGNRRRNRE